MAGNDNRSAIARDAAFIGALGAPALPIGFAHLAQWLAGRRAVDVLADGRR